MYNRSPQEGPSTSHGGDNQTINCSSHQSGLLQASYFTGRKLTAHRFHSNRVTEKWGKWGEMGENGEKWGGNGGKRGCGALVRASPQRVTCLLSLLRVIIGPSGLGEDISLHAAKQNHCPCPSLLTGWQTIGQRQGRGIIGGACANNPNHKARAQSMDKRYCLSHSLWCWCNPVEATWYACLVRAKLHVQLFLGYLLFPAVPHPFPGLPTGIRWGRMPANACQIKTTCPPKAGHQGIHVGKTVSLEVGAARPTPYPSKGKGPAGPIVALR